MGHDTTGIPSGVEWWDTMGIPKRVGSTMGIGVGVAGPNSVLKYILFILLAFLVDSFIFNVVVAVLFPIGVAVFKVEIVTTTAKVGI